MDKETRLEEQVREMIWALHPSLTGEDLASYDFGFGSVVELISMATHKACVEEREACIECAERWDGLVKDDSTVLSVREFITGERF